MDLLAVGPAAAAESPSSLVWTEPSPPAGVALLTGTGVSCPSTQDCVAVGGGYGYGAQTFVTTDGGTTWRVVQTLSHREFESVSCPTTLACVAVGETLHRARDVGVAEVSSDGGSTWSRVRLPRKTPRLWGVTCVSTRSCVAVGERGDTLTSADGGTTWRGTVAPGDDEALQSVSCGSPSHCVAVGQGSSNDGVIATTSDGGATWVSSYSAGLFLYGVSCPSAKRCVVVGTDGSAGLIVATSDGGTTWRNQASPPGSGWYENLGVSCASATHRVIAAGGVIATSDGGRKWTAQPIAMSNVLNGISCPAREHCVAVGNEGFATGTSPPRAS